MVFCVIIIVMLNSKKRSHNKLKPVQMEDNYQDVELSDEQQRVYNIHAYDWCGNRITT